MPQKRSDASRYESRYGGNFISPAQAISELMCERIAKKDKKSLSVKFWNLPVWKKIYMTQILAANSLLKLYSPKAIIAALRKDNKAFSLRAPWLLDAIQEEQTKIDNELEKLQEIIEEEKTTVKTDEKPREAFAVKQSTLSKLRDL